MQTFWHARMKHRIDVCNGDADGLSSVVQWRLHDPQTASLVTGLKREIGLLDQVQAKAGDEVLVCDLSMRRNRQSLLRLLDGGASIHYFDHHDVDQIPAHPHLLAHINLAGDTCSSLLVDRYLQGRYRTWAIVGAYGDHLTGVADALGSEIGLTTPERQALQVLGESINYNAYGENAGDVYIAPIDLYRILIRYPDPLALLEHESIARELDAQKQSDLRQAADLAPYWQDAHVRVYLLPDAPWSRRAIGCLGNLLARTQPQQAHALLKARAGGHFMVSVRAPLCARAGAGALCRRFGGDGRAGAAGIDHLPAKDLASFIQAFSANRWSNLPNAPSAL